jgi:hypothetical protein
MKKLFLIFISFFALAALAQDVGRVKLTLPKGEWITISTQEYDLEYGGPKIGSLKAETTTRALVDKDKNLLGIFFIRAGANSLSSGTMKWGYGCKKHDTEYIDDATKGSVSGLDCLRVWRSMDPDHWLMQITKNTYTELQKRGVKVPKKGYRLLHHVGNGIGTFVYTSAILAFEPLAGIPSAAKVANAKYTGMPGVAYGQLLAGAARESIGSLSGEFAIPQIDYR